MVGVSLAITVTALFAVEHPRPLADAEAARVFGDLHGKLTRIHSARDEAEIRQVLSASLHGNALEEAVVKAREERDARELEGSRFEVRRVKPLETEVLPEAPWSGTGFRVRHRWRVYAIVSHEAHRHARTDDFEAVYSVGERNGEWRITAVRPVN